MIVGNGLLAKAFCKEFQDDDDIVIFASGVSNSRENRPEQFLRERMLLDDAISKKKFLLYFSTCSIADAALADTMYVKHKQQMEAMIFERLQRRAVFRLPQVVGVTPNPNTLTNYLHQQIISGNRFQVWANAKRNLIDVDDVAAIVTHLVRTGRVEGKLINVACPYSVTILDLVQHFEDVLDVKANYETVAAGAEYMIECGLASQAATEIDIGFSNQYIPNLLRKYYAKVGRGDFSKYSVV